MKVLILMPLAEQRGGAEMALWHLMQHCRAAGIRWAVLFLEEGPLAVQSRELGLPTMVVRAGRLRALPRFVAAVGRIALLLRRERPDLVLSWMTVAHLYGSPAAWLTGVPSAWYQHGLASRRSWIDRLATLLPARAILTCSATSAASQSRLGPRRALHIAYPGVDLERFDPAALPSPDALRRRLGLPAGGPLIGIIGRLQRWKGMHTLLEAMPAVLRRHPDAHGVIVGGAHRGEAAYPAYLRERIAGLHLEEHVTMTGQQANIPEWMQAMDVVVHASDREPFGIVLLEAMALGKPVVAGDRGGPTEVITDGVDGLLTPYGDAQALAGAILRYLDDPAFARRTGSAARARARAFALPSTTQKLVGTIACLGSSHGQARRGVNPTVTRETG